MARARAPGRDETLRDEERGAASLPASPRDSEAVFCACFIRRCARVGGSSSL
jgi:hypothetical protein